MSLRTTLAITSEFQARLLLILSILALVLQARQALRGRNLLFLVILASFIYQIGMNIAAYHLRIYTSNQLVFLMIVLAVWVQSIWHMRFKFARRGSADR